MNFLKKISFLFLFLMILLSCSQEKPTKIYRIGFSQAMTTDNWRKEMNKSMKLEASMHPNLELQISDAQNRVDSQISQIERFIDDSVDVLIVSPIKSVPITPVIEKAMKAGIPTIVIDRKIEGSNYTAYVGANNTEIGRNAARYILSSAEDSVTVMEIRGQQGSSPAYERSSGFREILARAPSIRIVHTINGDWEKSSVKPQLEKILDSANPPDYIFAHNDRMALGAWEVARKRSLHNEIKIIGVDGLFGPNGGIQFVKEGILDATILYPTGGAEAIKLASRLLEDEMVKKNNILNTVIIDSVNVDIMQNQFDKMNQQQNDIEKQQDIIDRQITTYNSQSNLIKLMMGLLSLLIILSAWSIYLVVKLRRRKRSLEENNRKIIAQRNQIEDFAGKLKESNEMRINFFTALSHEFKTPLTLISSSIESIAENSGKHQKDFNYETNLIFNNSRRLLRLINELLDFRKLESSKPNIKPVKTNLYEFAEIIFDDFKPEALRKSIKMEMIADRKDLEVYIDRDMMDKVLFNILSNAFKFTPKNGHIRLQIKDLSENEMGICIKDSGIGIPKEDFEKIFNPFMQAANNDKPSSGLGLYITKQFVELHKGTISVSSRQGSEFSITLQKGKDHLKEYQTSDILRPIKSDKNHQLFTENLPEEEGAVEVLSESAVTILIIEDNPDLSRLLKKRLLTDYQVYLSDGTDALEKALDIIPDIILCDINLPEKSGFEICRELKNDLRTSHIPTLILTALSDEESKLKALQAGADSYITKPFSFGILKESLRAALYNREKLRYYYTNRIHQVKDEKFDNSEQVFLKDLNRIISNNLMNADFSVEDLAKQLHISRVQLYRKVKALLGLSISEYINTQRLSKAKNLLQESDLNISEIAYKVGYSSPGYFSTSFKNKYGTSPKDFRG